jgi:hypothetical protein
MTTPNEKSTRSGTTRETTAKRTHAEERGPDADQGEALLVLPGREENHVGREEGPEGVAPAIALEQEHEDGKWYGAPNPVARILVEAP